PHSVRRPVVYVDAERTPGARTVSPTGGETKRKRLPLCSSPWTGPRTVSPGGGDDVESTAGRKYVASPPGEAVEWPRRGAPTVGGRRRRYGVADPQNSPS